MSCSILIKRRCRAQPKIKIMRLRKQSDKDIGKIAWGSISDEEIEKLAKMDEDEVAGFL